MVAHKTGGDVDAYCNKCKLVLAHVIIAMDGTRLVRVECKTCRALHAYKKSAGTPKAPGTATRRTSKAKGVGSRSGMSPNDYEKIMKGQDLSRAQRYRSTINFSESDVVDHTSFGMGMVVRVLADAKMEVLFPTGVKVLVHAR